MKMIGDGRYVVLLLVVATSFIFGGVFATALQYDYSVVTDCLVEPLKPQYNGGIMVNSEFNDGLKGWASHGDVKIEPRTSSSGNKYAVALSRKNSNSSLSYSVPLEKDKLYTFSAWIQVTGRDNTPVAAVFETSEGLLLPAGSVIAHVGCWSMLKGGVTADFSGPTQLFFESNDTTVDIWVDSVSLQPFTIEEWKSHQDQSIEKVRKSEVKFQVVDEQGKSLPNTNISITQNNGRFPLGASINNNILKNQAYQNWFTKRFKVTTFENEMKWYTTENTPGKEDYSQADAMLGFASQHGISVRGHNIFWDDPQYQPWWVKSLSSNDLLKASNKRLYSVVKRYSGKVIAWDVNNENLHFNFYESKLGNDITNKFFLRTRQLDRRATLFMNEYNTIEDGRDGSSSPSKYVQKIHELQGYLGRGANFYLAIGLEGHFQTPNLAYIRSALDTLASTRLPIWITELDVAGGPNQVQYFEQIIREVHSHPGVKGIVIWGPWSSNGQCYRMCLVDPNFRNLGPGNVVDKLLGEWGLAQVVSGTTDENGFFTASLFHGDYEAKFSRQEDAFEVHSSSFEAQSFSVDHHSTNQVIRIVRQSS